MIEDYPTSDPLAPVVDAINDQQYVRALALIDQHASPSTDIAPRLARLKTQALLGQNQIEEAHDAATLALALDASSITAHTALAQIAWKLGHKQKAQQAFESALRLSDYNPEIHAEYAVFMACERTSSIGEQAVQKACEACPDSSDAVAARGLIYLRQNNIPKAEPLLRRALDLNPQNPRAMAWMVILLEKTKRHIEAAELTKLLEDHPDASEFIQSIRNDQHARYVKQKLFAKPDIANFLLADPPQTRAKRLKKRFSFFLIPVLLIPAYFLSTFFSPPVLVLIPYAIISAALLTYSLADH